MTKLFSTTLLATLALAGAASAATIAWSPTPTSSMPNPLADETTGVVYENITGSVKNDFLSPFGMSDTTNPYTSVQANSSATYSFGVDNSSLSFVWGSPDTFNTLAFYDDGQLVEIVSYSGTPTGVNLPNGQATIYTVGVFDEVVFSSTRDAFEFANLTASVPVPAAGLLLLTALGAVGVARRRKAA